MTELNWIICWAYVVFFFQMSQCVYFFSFMWFWQNWFLQILIQTKHLRVSYKFVQCVVTIQNLNYYRCFSSWKLKIEKLVEVKNEKSHFTNTIIDFHRPLSNFNSKIHIKIRSVTIFEIFTHLPILNLQFSTAS